MATTEVRAQRSGGNKGVLALALGAVGVGLYELFKSSNAAAPINPNPNPNPKPNPTPGQPPLPVLPPPPPWFAGEPVNTQLACLAYVDLLGHYPDQASAEGVWTQIINAPRGLYPNSGGQAGVDAVAFQIIAAPGEEFNTYFQNYLNPPVPTGPQFPDAWVQAAYACILGRWPAAGEEAPWVAGWNSGQGRIDVALGIAFAGLDARVRRQLAAWQATTSISIPYAAGYSGGSVSGMEY